LTELTLNRDAIQLILACLYFELTVDLF